MLLTVGMATVRDYSGPYFTIQDVRKIFQYFGFADYELIVVDNDPEDDCGRALRRTVEGNARFANQGARYIPFGEAHGTTQPRQRIFDEARGDWVMVCDSHVGFDIAGLGRLPTLLEQWQGTRDILSGPVWYDDLQGTSTHFEPVWRDEMWGTWASDPRGEGDTPFEITGQGLGCFIAHREHFVGFDRRWRGFGGEELCIHEAVRQAGGRAMCIPSLKWYHRWHREAHGRYTAWTWHKVRNYVLGFQRIGRPLDEIYQHFVVERQKLRESEWAALIADPEQENPPGVTLPLSGRSVPILTAAAWKPGPSPHPQPAQLGTIGDLARFLAEHPRDLDQHAQWIASQAAGRRVVELTKRRESTVFLLAGAPAFLTTFSTEPDPIHEAARIILDAAPIKTTEWALARGQSLDSLAVEIPPCDVLYVDTVMHEDRIYAELVKHGPKVAETIIVRGTGQYGVHAEGGGRGLYYGIYRWIGEERERGREWVLIDRRENQYGIAAWSCSPDAVPMPLGPGGELAEILRTMAVEAGPGCDCKARQAQMDAWGVAGCREHRAEILAWIEDGAPRWGWVEKLKAAALAVKSGLAWRLSPTDPYGSLIDLAIDRAEAKAAKAAQAAGKEMPRA